MEYVVLQDGRPVYPVTPESGRQVPYTNKQKAFGDLWHWSKCDPARDWAMQFTRKDGTSFVLHFTVNTRKTK